ncbi:MAG: hypothetical protein IPK83_18520 [Planctomycetes bacterium]|nr:hypothetical protein [Planctomycetota bacterium]
MKAVLVRIGVDQAYGGWNAPVDPTTGAFVYVPIPESATSFHPGCRRTFGEFIPALTRFYEERRCEPQSRLSRQAMDESVHLDPDFEHLTYGDDGQHRGSAIAEFERGDLLVFYAGLKPLGTYVDKLMYAIVGLFVVDEVVPIANVIQERWHENAHTRKSSHGKHDIVVRARAR